MSDHPVTKAIDALAVGSIVATLMGWLPTISVALSCVWFTIQILESDTFAKFCRWLYSKLRRS